MSNIGSTTMQTYPSQVRVAGYVRTTAEEQGDEDSSPAHPECERGE